MSHFDPGGDSEVDRLIMLFGGDGAQADHSGRFCTSERLLLVSAIGHRRLICLRARE